jgi:hypothetical protein
MEMVNCNISRKLKSPWTCAVWCIGNASGDILWKSRKRSAVLRFYSVPPAKFRDDNFKEVNSYLPPQYFHFNRNYITSAGKTASQNNA